MFCDNKMLNKKLDLIKSKSIFLTHMPKLEKYNKEERSQQREIRTAESCVIKGTVGAEKL